MSISFDRQMNWATPQLFYCLETVKSLSQGRLPAGLRNFASDPDGTLPPMSAGDGDAGCPGEEGRITYTQPSPPSHPHGGRGVHGLAVIWSPPIDLPSFGTLADVWSANAKEACPAPPEVYVGTIYYVW